jgi:integrase
MSTQQSESQASSRVGEQERYTERNLALTSRANQGDLARILRIGRLHNRAPGSNANFSLVVRRADEYLKRPLRTMTANEALGLMEHLAKLPGKNGKPARPKVVHGRSILLRAYLKELLGVRALPHDLDRATFIPKPEDEDVGHYVTDEQFRAILEAAVRAYRGPSAPRKAALAAALLWALWDSGLRAGELLSLNVGEVELRDERKGILHLRQARRGNRLKTGARQIAITDAAPALRLWLERHPAASNPDAPLFPGLLSKDGLRGLEYRDLYDMVVRAGHRSGVSATLSDDDQITPHDLRHTYATNTARLGDAVLRKQLGWSRKSAMPGHYTNKLPTDKILDHLSDLADSRFGKPPLMSASAQVQVPARPVPIATPKPAPVPAAPTHGLAPSLEDQFLDALMLRVATKMRAQAA